MSKKNKLDSKLEITSDKEVVTISKLQEKCKFNLIHSYVMENFLNEINLNYEYLFGFISFAKLVDPKICCTAISKEASLWGADLDIKKCINEYDKGNEHIIYYVEHKFSHDCEISYGEEFRNVYLMFIGKSEVNILELLYKFNKVKAFV